jgi:hypothetical protein
VAAEEEQAEADLRDQDGLRERDQVRDEPARLAAAVIGDPRGKGLPPRHGEHEECDGAVRR